MTLTSMTHGPRAAWKDAGPGTGPAEDPETGAEPLLRTLAPQVLGAVIRRFGDFASAEDAVQEALIAAAVQWPEQGVPAHPGAWLIQVASRRMSEYVRREGGRHRRETMVSEERPRDLAPSPERDAASPDDDTLILLFMCAHPELSEHAAIAACSWYGPIGARASASLISATPSSIDGRCQRVRSCSASGTSAPSGSVRAARRASVSSISASRPATSPSPGRSRCSSRASRIASRVRPVRCSSAPVDAV